MHISAINTSAVASAVISRSDLAKAFPIVLEAISKRSTVPVYSMARIVADGMGARIVGTDNEMEISVRLPGAVDSRFDLCLSAHTFADLLKKAPASDMVAFSAPAEGEDKATADFERITYKLPSLAGEAFPALELADASASFEMAGSAFRDALSLVSGAVSTEETRYYLNGVFVHAYMGELVMIATDGHRLYRQRLPMPQGAADMPGVILPRATVATLLKLMKGKACPSSISVAVSEAGMAFTFGDIVVRSKVIDGTFPDYNRVIPTRNDRILLVDAKALAEGVKGVATISNERGRAVRLSLSASAVALQVNDPSNGSAETTVAADFEGDEMDIGFNARYLLDILDTMGATMRGAFADSGSPTRFTGEIEGFDAVLMPMRV